MSEITSLLEVTISGVHHFMERNQSQSQMEKSRSHGSHARPWPFTNCDTGFWCGRGFTSGNIKQWQTEQEQDSTHGLTETQ